MQPPSLRSVAQTIIIRTLVCSPRDCKERELLLETLMTTKGTCLSEDILLAVTELFPKEVTDELLCVLAPQHLRQLKLKGCTSLTCDGVVKTITKCSHLTYIDFSCCENLLRPAVYCCLRDNAPGITHLSFEDCDVMTDDGVQIILMCCPGLEHLNISSCSNITDKAFALSSSSLPNKSSKSPLKLSQRALLGGKNLSSVDLSGCRSLTSAVVKYLVALCGPTLTSVNISWTDLGCTALLYLAGLSTRAAIQFVRQVDSSCLGVFSSMTEDEDNGNGDGNSNGESNGAGGGEEVPKKEKKKPSEERNQAVEHCSCEETDKQEKSNVENSSGEAVTPVESSTENKQDSLNNIVKKNNGDENKQMNESGNKVEKETMVIRNIDCTESFEVEETRESLNIEKHENSLKVETEIVGIEQVGTKRVGQVFEDSLLSANSQCKYAGNENQESVSVRNKKRGIEGIELKKENDTTGQFAMNEHKENISPKKAGEIERTKLKEEDLEKKQSTDMGQNAKDESQENISPKKAREIERTKLKEEDLEKKQSTDMGQSANDESQENISPKKAGEIERTKLKEEDLEKKQSTDMGQNAKDESQENISPKKAGEIERTNLKEEDLEKKQSTDSQSAKDESQENISPKKAREIERTKLKEEDLEKKQSTDMGQNANDESQENISPKKAGEIERTKLKEEDLKKKQSTDMGQSTKDESQENISPKKEEEEEIERTKSKVEISDIKKDIDMVQNGKNTSYESISPKRKTVQSKRTKLKEDNLENKNYDLGPNTTGMKTGHGFQKTPASMLLSFPTVGVPPPSTSGVNNYRQVTRSSSDMNALEEEWMLAWQGVGEEDSCSDNDELFDSIWGDVQHSAHVDSVSSVFGDAISCLTSALVNLDSTDDDDNDDDDDGGGGGGGGGDDDADDDADAATAAAADDDDAGVGDDDGGGDDDDDGSSKDIPNDGINERGCDVDIGFVTNDDNQGKAMQQEDVDADDDLFTDILNLQEWRTEDRSSLLHGFNDALVSLANAMGELMDSDDEGGGGGGGGVDDDDVKAVADNSFDDALDHGNDEDAFKVGSLHPITSEQINFVMLSEDDNETESDILDNKSALASVQTSSVDNQEHNAWNIQARKSSHSHDKVTSSDILENNPATSTKSSSSMCSEASEDAKSDTLADELSSNNPADVRGEVNECEESSKAGLEKSNPAKDSFHNTKAESASAFKDDSVTFSVDAECPEKEKEPLLLTLTYKPRLRSLDITNINFQNRALGVACLKLFFSLNTTLESFALSWSDLDDDTLIAMISKQPGLRSLKLTACENLRDQSLASLPVHCPLLESVDLRGVAFVTDLGVVPMLDCPRLKTLSLAETSVTDITMFALAEKCGDKLRDLDLSWCEGLTDKGRCAMAESCTGLKSFALRQCTASRITMETLSIYCQSMTSLDLSSVGELTDQVVVAMVTKLPNLAFVDISWNQDVTSTGVSALLSHCGRLEEAVLSGLKALTTKPFLGIISDLPRWRTKQEVMLRRKLKSKQSGGPVETYIKPCDMETARTLGEDLPFRSTTYSPILRQLVLEYSDMVNDEHLSQIVAVCRGTLNIRDYYGQPIEPTWIFL